MTNLDAVRAKIIELVPDIGRCPYCKGQGWTTEHGSNHNPETGECEACPIQVQCEHCQATGITEPKEITLTDVLRAMNVAQKVFMGDWLINTRGHFVKSLIDGRTISQAERWNLALSLDEQEPEAIEFLHRILCI